MELRAKSVHGKISSSLQHWANNSLVFVQFSGTRRRSWGSGYLLEQWTEFHYIQVCFPGVSQTPCISMETEPVTLNVNTANTKRSLTEWALFHVLLSLSKSFSFSELLFWLIFSFLFGRVTVTCVTVTTADDVCLSLSRNTFGRNENRKQVFVFLKWFHLVFWLHVELKVSFLFRFIGPLIIFWRLDRLLLIINLYRADLRDAQRRSCVKHIVYRRFPALLGDEVVFFKVFKGRVFL